MRKQTKPEPLRTPIVKMILVVAIIVFLGAALGVAGHLIISKPKINPPVVITLPPAEGKVAITTDKTEYEQGEEISLAIKNNSGTDMFLTQLECTIDREDNYLGGKKSSMPYLQSFKNGKWEDFNWHYFTNDASAAKCLSSLECVDKVEEIKFSKIPTDFIGLLLDSGKYRIKMEFGKSCQKNIGLSGTFIIYSNEFTIKEKIASDTSDWQTYRNEEYGFEVKYPNIYTQLSECSKNLVATCLVDLKHSNVADATISVWFMDKNFNLQDIKQRFAPTGNENLPEQVTAGQNTFYFYGPGGGGVSYPDNYFYNLNGKILIIDFDGPYINDKTPSDETKQLEPQILSTFKFTEK